MNVLDAIESEIQHLQEARAILLGGSTSNGLGRPKMEQATPKSGGRKPMSAEARARIGAAQRKRWAEANKAEKKSVSAGAKRVTGAVARMG